MDDVGLWKVVVVHEASADDDGWFGMRAVAAGDNWYGAYGAIVSGRGD